MALLPAHPDGMTDHHVEGQVILEAHLWIGFDKGHQRKQAFAAELSVFRCLDPTEQMVDLGGEIALPWCFLENEAAVEAIAPLQLVANHQAAAVLQQRPDPGIEIAGNFLEGTQADAVLKPVPTPRCFLQRVRH